jgi:hypothetical protein
MTDDLDELADAVEDWKQTKYHLERLVQSVFDSDVDPEAFRDEFVEDDHPVDPKLFELIEDLADQG